MSSAKCSAATCRHLAAEACRSLLKPEAWHLRQLHRATVQAAAASGWYTRQLTDAAAAPAAGAAAPGAGVQDSRASVYAQRSSAAGAGGCSTTERWQPGPCDRHPQCSSCQQEQQERSAAEPSAAGSRSSNSGSSVSSSLFTCFPVQYDDPFLYRRLLWQLLGKVSPEAQAFLSKQANGCPHCPSLT